MTFDWRRAIEAAAVTALIAGGTALETAINNPEHTGRAVLIAVGTTVLATFIKGVWQQFALTLSAPKTDAASSPEVQPDEL